MSRRQLSQETEWITEPVDAHVGDLINPRAHETRLSAEEDAFRWLDEPTVAYVDVAKRVRIWDVLDDDLESETYMYTERFRLVAGAVIATQLLTPDGLSPLELPTAPSRILEA